MKKVMLCLILVIVTILPLSVNAVRNDQTILIEEYMEKAIQEYQIPGVSLAIIKDGEIMFQENWGIQSDGSRVTTDTLFTLGSVSKPLTSLAIMRLVEQGEIELDHSIDTYLPTFTYHKNDYKNDITIRDLLAHTSGISSFEGLKISELKLRGEDSINEAVEKLNNVKLNHEPGEVHQYSPANYLLLASIIEHITNKTFSEYMESEIFSTLDMNNTVSNYEAALDLEYQPGFQSWFGRPIKSENFFDDSGVPYGYIASTSNDMLKYIDFLLEGGELLTDQYFELYTSPQVWRKEDMYYGLGWRISTKKNDEFFFHGGETPDSRAELFINRQKNYGFILLTNKNNFSEVLHTFYIREGIKTILEDNRMPDIPKSNYQMQWITLIVTCALAILILFNLFRLKRKVIIHVKYWNMVAVLSVILSISLIPILTYLFDAPWRTIYSFAPDTAIFIRILVGILAFYGITSLIIINVKRRKRV
ncbi:serine hydrolase [Psychrobacillus vulpis]|uniref:Penicillin-binding protein n=1 Tax=Psychrobacillus vulpis TaxID=2325572 RepID=A0A544TV05_9BACI|nr:serine hydrolase [Psychrobacillus vulpis]TQR21271.1 penicillin-binding protein [Psychrobacillus vulpis]